MNVVHHGTVDTILSRSFHRLFYVNESVSTLADKVRKFLDAGQSPAKVMGNMVDSKHQKIGGR